MKNPSKARNQPPHERTLTYLRAILTGRQRRQQYFATLYNSNSAHLHIICLFSPQDAELWLDRLKNNCSSAR